MKYWIRKIFIHSYKKYIFLMILGGIISITNLFFHSFNHKIYYVNGTSIAGLSLIFMGCLSILSYFGAYEFWGYTFSRKDFDGRRMEYSDYIAQKKAKRDSRELPFGPYFVVGAVYLLVSFVIFLTI